MVSETAETGVRLCVAHVVSARYSNSGTKEFSGGGGGNVCRFLLLYYLEVDYTGPDHGVSLSRDLHEYSGA